MMDELERWLEEKSLGDYLELFRDHDIRFSDLPHMTEDDVREIGLPLGARPGQQTESVLDHLELLSPKAKCIFPRCILDFSGLAALM